MNIDLLNILGRSYVIDNCTAYIGRKNREKYRDYYFADMLLLINNRLRQEKEPLEIPRLSDLFEPKKEITRTQSAEAVKTQIKAKFKALRKGGKTK